ncbi:DUF4157 domain-containing protein [Undibacterium sp. Ji49W]|uniref:eCIS core domain-containing protein n=1 Tax=Undibacterium sp. Ji49W TaxID=3413040 RepID=UPI003BF40C39
MDNSPQARQMQATAQRMQQHTPQRQPIQPPVQRQAGHAADGHAPASNNTGMPDNLKAGVENLSGMAMDDVKVHYNSAQPAAMQAHAFAQGTDIHIAPGQEQHLPHEAWHVVQQKQGRVRPTFQMKSGTSINDDVGLESEADIMGARALSAGTTVVKSGVGQDGGVAQAMAVSGRPVFQLMKLKGTLIKDKKSIRKGNGSEQEINADAKWGDAECKDGDVVDYEWDSKNGITIIYGDSRTPLERRLVAVEGKAHEEIKPTSVDCSEEAAQHSWERHTPSGIFFAQKSGTAYAGDNVAMFDDMSLEELSAFIAKECAAGAAYAWEHEGGSKRRGRRGNIEMICTSMDGKLFSVDTCYPKNKSIPKATIEAALKAHSDDFDAFLAALAGGKSK